VGTLSDGFGFEVEFSRKVMDTFAIEFTHGRERKTAELVSKVKMFGVQVGE
jgi:hypothetical protein